MGIIGENDVVVSSQFELQERWWDERQLSKLFETLTKKWWFLLKASPKMKVCIEPQLNQDALNNNGGSTKYVGSRQPIGFDVEMR
jgi:hypothetical protein